MTDIHVDKKAGATRRTFLKTAVTTGTVLASNLTLLSNVHAAGSDILKIGLIGCGGRGTGAADNCLNSAPNVKLVAMGDVFKDRIEGCLHNLSKNGDKVEVSPQRQFLGLDAFKNVLATDIDYVILATPPGFRPIHLQAAVAAGKNIFTEKPVAVDGPGVRKVLEAAEEAQKKNLGVVAGTQRRHQLSYRETMKRLHDGAIGDIVGGRCYWNQGSLWHRDKAQMGNLEWQIRNWLYFSWLSGDHICEQHVHNLDVINWGIGTHPVRAVGMGGRQVRTAPVYGNIFDHFAVDYEYPKNVHVMSMCRQIEGCENNVSEAFVGTKGMCTTIDRTRYTITGENKWSFSSKKENDPYVQEHTDLIESIRSGKPLNELKRIAESTLTAIMGRMSAYTGKPVTWEKALNSQEELMPRDLDWNISIPVAPVAIPGKTHLA